MARIDLPSGILTLETTLKPEMSGQIQHIIPSSGAAITYNQGPGFWTGTTTWKTRRDERTAQAVEAMLAALNGTDNYFELPLNRQTIQNNLIITGAQPGAWTIGDKPEDLVDGTYLRFNNRLFICTQAESENINVWPLVSTAPNGTARPARSVRAEVTRIPELRKTPNWSGPWSIAWRERL